MMISIVKTLCLFDETSREEDEAEEPGSSTQEQARFDWAQIWMKDGGSLTLEEVNHMAYSSRYYL